MAARVAILVLGLAYPLLAYAALRFWGFMELGAVTLAAGIARIGFVARRATVARQRVDPLGALLVLVGLVIVASGTAVAARLYPVIVNAGALGYFAHTLIYPPSAVERIARMTDPDLSKHGVVYTRRVTVLWTAFFGLNGCVALYTALWSSIEVWTLYNGVVAYLLMGLLFAGEYVVRCRVRVREVGR